MVPEEKSEKPFHGVSPLYWFGLIFAYLLFPLTLMLSGNDWGWWQGWLYSGSIFIAGIGTRLLAEVKHPGLLVERGKFGKARGVKSWDKILAPLMGVSLSFPLFIVAGLDHRFGWSQEFAPWINTVGFILVVSGYMFAGWALAENRFFSMMVRIQTDRGHTVCDTGPYTIVRHPGYAGNILPLIGTILALGSVWTTIPAMFALAILVIRTILEDRTLQDELPGYREYASRVRYRLVPWIF